MSILLQKICVIGMVVLTAGFCPIASAAEGHCGLSDDGAAVPGTGFAGYWRSTLGIVRLVRYGGNTLEGPASASMYMKGTDSGTVFQGHFAEDTGEYHPGTITLTLSNEGRCFKGHLVYDDGEDGGDDWVGYRLPGPTEPHYTDIYTLTERTEHLKQMVGGILTWEQLDGPDVLDMPATSGASYPTINPPAPPATPNPSGFPSYPNPGPFGNGGPFIPTQPAQTVPLYPTPGQLGNGFPTVSTPWQQNPSFPQNTWRPPGGIGTPSHQGGHSPAAGNTPNASQATSTWKILGSSGPGHQSWQTGPNQYRVVDLFKDATLQVKPVRDIPSYVFAAQMDKEPSGPESPDQRILHFSLVGNYTTDHSVKGLVKSVSTLCMHESWGAFELFFNPGQGTASGQFTFPPTDDTGCKELNAVFWGSKQ